jgi:hypothetical protein
MGKRRSLAFILTMVFHRRIHGELDFNNVDKRFQASQPFVVVVAPHHSICTKAPRLPIDNAQMLGSDPVLEPTATETIYPGTALRLISKPLRANQFPQDQES